MANQNFSLEDLIDFKPQILEDILRKMQQEIDILKEQVSNLEQQQTEE